MDTTELLYNLKQIINNDVEPESSRLVRVMNMLNIFMLDKNNNIVHKHHCVFTTAGDIPTPMKCMYCDNTIGPFLNQF